MTEKSKVVAGLTYCHTMLSNMGIETSDCGKCPYNNGKPDENQNVMYCVANLVEDALKMVQAEPYEDMVSIKTILGLPRQIVIDSETDEVVEQRIDVKDIEALLSVRLTPTVRLMTVEDFEDNPRADKGGDIPVYIEDRSGYCEWMLMDAERFDRCTESGFYRVWSEKPTDAQREATPWSRTD